MVLFHLVSFVLNNKKEVELDDELSDKFLFTVFVLVVIFKISSPATKKLCFLFALPNGKIYDAIASKP